MQRTGATDGPPVSVTVQTLFSPEISTLFSYSSRNDKPNPVGFFQMDKKEVFDLLHDRGIKKVVVSFDGGNDEGGVSSITLEHSDDTTSEMNEWYPSSTYDPETRTWKESSPPSKDEELSKALCKPVYDKYSSFAGEFYVNGEVIWDVVSRKATMSGDEEVSSYEPFEEEL